MGHAGVETMQVETFAKSISIEALAALGAEEIAYVKPQRVDGETVYFVFAADGRELGGFGGREVAFAACRQNDLEPLSVH
jgi:hypothetical protein